MGSVAWKSALDHVGVSESPKWAVTSRSTSMSRLLVSLMPVVEGLPVQTPAWSVAVRLDYVSDVEWEWVTYRRRLSKSYRLLAA